MPLFHGSLVQVEQEGAALHLRPVLTIIEDCTDMMRHAIGAEPHGANETRHQALGEWNPRAVWLFSY